MSFLTPRPTALPDQLRALLKEQNALLLVLQEMLDGILICDAEGKLLFFNDAFKKLYGLTDNDLYRTCHDAIPDETLNQAIRVVLKAGEPISQELAIAPKTGKEKFLQFHGVPLSIEEEGSTGISTCVAVFHDITAIKRTEKMRRDFVANVSHELRTPLSAIKGYAETLLDGALEDVTVAKDFVSVIHSHSIRLSRLVEDLLDLSKLESPDFLLELKPIALKPMVSRVISMAEANVTAKGLVLFTHFPEDLPPVLANISSVEQVFTNLLDNAVKYTPKGGKVAVSAFEINGKVQVNVTDTGIGIEAKHIPRLFERFYRVDKARSREQGGTGLGLSIVKHIIQTHGGEMWVESEPNKGSTFSFTLNKAIED